jgi:hypothetical protein
MRRLFASLVLLLAGLSPAVAQQVSVPTYYASVLNLNTTVDATDVLCLEGAAGKVVKLNGLFVAGTAAAAATIDIMLLRRITLNVGASNRINATAGSPTSNPSAAALKLYTAVPTSLGAIDVAPRGFAFRRNRWDISPTYSVPLGWPSIPLFAVDPYTAQPEIRSATSAICLNYATVKTPVTTINLNVTWTETDE